jgi:hypothetical protein
MFTTDLTLTDGTTPVTYSQISLENKKCIRQDATRPLGTPRTLTISHETTGKGMTAVDRHLVRLDLVEEDTGSDDIATVSASTYMVLHVPRRIVTTTMIKHMIDCLTAFMAVEANQDKVLNSEP